LKKLIHTVPVALNVIASASLLTVYAGCFVSPEKIWWFTFFGLFYNHILVINLIFIVLWLFTKKKKRVFISLLPVLVGFNMIGRSFQLFAGKSPETENKIKIATYNVAFFHGRNNHEVNLFDFFKNSEVDIICMQEFAAQQDSIAKWLDKPYFHIEQPGKWAQGIATYSKYPVIGNRLVYHDSTLNAAMYSDIVIRADTVRVFNIHLRTSGLRAAYDGFRRRKEGKQLFDALKEEYRHTSIEETGSEIALNVAARSKQADQIAQYIAASPYPVIICGDFNDTPASYPYQKIRGGNKDAFVESGKGRGVTYNIRTLLAQRIDFILHSPAYRAFNFEVPHVLYSDHYPVMCDLIKRKK
jgi:endonuclease/exonuclease/phosphatase family metal-dependent hydrolase